MSVTIKLTRRRLLLGGTAVALGARYATLAAAPASATLEPPAFWHTVRALQEHLFPAVPGTPGVAEINATAYLAAVLLDPRIDAPERELLGRGVGLLEAYAGRRHGASFSALDEETREAVLRRIEESPQGQAWLSLIIYYLLEALLADPVYGGNPQGIGWHWLSHQPGAPRPPLGWYEAARPDDV